MVENFDGSHHDDLAFRNEEEELYARVSVVNVYPELFASSNIFDTKLPFAILLNKAGITEEELDAVIAQAETITMDDIVKSEFIKYTPILISVREKLRKALEVL